MATTITSNRLREARQITGLRQAELAVKAGVSIATLSRAEAWGVPIGPDTARRICRALQMPLRDVFPTLTRNGERRRRGAYR